MTALDHDVVAEAFGTVITHDGDRTVVELRGEIDMNVSPALETVLRDLVADDHVHLVLDLTALEFIDSSGLAAFVAANRAAVAAGGDVHLRSPRPSTMRILETTRLTELLPLEA